MRAFMAEQAAVVAVSPGWGSSAAAAAVTAPTDPSAGAHPRIAPRSLPPTYLLFDLPPSLRFGSVRLHANACARVSLRSGETFA